MTLAIIKNSNAAPAIFYSLLSLLILAPLLGPGYYLALDMQFGPNSFAEQQFDDLYGYAPSSYGAYLPVRLALAAVSQLLPVEIVEKLLLFAILFLCGMGAHCSLPKELGNARYFAGLLYMLNPFVFVRFLAGHWTLLLSYALFPPAIALFRDFLKKPDGCSAFAGVALITTAAAVSSHGVAMLLLCYAVLFIVHAARNGPRPVLLKRSAFLAALVLAMNLFWIAPTLMLYSQTYSPVSAEAYMKAFGAIGGGMPLPLALLTMHGFWREGYTYTKDVAGLWYVPFAAILLIACLGFAMLLKKDRTLALSLAAAFAISFLLALGLEGPLAWIFTALPQLSFIFRDSQKFVALLALSYSVLGAYGVHAAAEICRKRWKRIPVHVPLLVLLAVPVICNYGFFGFLGQAGPTQYPDEWKSAEAVMSADATPGNVLLLPLHLYNHYDWVNCSVKTLAVPEAQFFSRPVISGHSVEMKDVWSDTNIPSERYVQYLFENRGSINNTAGLLLPLNARYIMLSKEDEDSPHYLYMFKRMGGVPGIEQVFEGRSFWLFRNNLAKGPFTATADNGSGGFEALASGSAGAAYADVGYEKINPGILPHTVPAAALSRFCHAARPLHGGRREPCPLVAWSRRLVPFRRPGRG